MATIAIGQLIATGISPDRADRVRRLLQRYLDLLAEAAGPLGLLSTGDAGDSQRLVQRHILDSIAPWPVVASALADSASRRIHDLGSGAGLPGVPLAVVLHHARELEDQPLEEVVLVERGARRAAFLREVAEAMAEIPLRIVEADTDTLHAREADRGGVHLAVFRAYQQTSPKFLKKLAKGCGPGVRVVAWKGRHESAYQEQQIVGESEWAADPAVSPVEVPGLDAERCVLSWTTRRR